LFLLIIFKALNGLLCADVPLRNYSLTGVIPQFLVNDDEAPYSFCS